MQSCENRYFAFRRTRYCKIPIIKNSVWCGKKEGNACAILNAANEIAVQAFLNEQIEFLDIERLISDALENIEYIENATLDEVFETDMKTRAYVNSLVKGGNEWVRLQTF